MMKGGKKLQNMGDRRFSIGLDLGTNSMRALLVDISTGEEIATEVFNYEKGENGVITDPKNPNIARQHPIEYIKGIEVCIKGVLKKAKKNKNFNVENIIGIGIDTTASTPLPVDKNGEPLAFHKEFKDNINAYAWLWKDHSSYAEAEEITELASKEYPEYVNKYGGKYSSEWFFSKILHCLRVDKKVFDAAYSWVECSDYIPGVLTGKQKPQELKRNICAAGHKGMYNPLWGGLPCKEFLTKLSPELGKLRDRLFEKAYTADTPAGKISKEWARKLGLHENVIIAVGSVDAHLGAVGSGIKPGRLVKIIGTSTCDMAVLPNTKKLPDIPGVCGIVDGSILPGYWGIEAGQSAVGDIFNWFVKKNTPYEYLKEAAKKKISIHELFMKKAMRFKPGETGLLALDWHNGNRTILIDPLLTGLIIGETLQTKPEEIYRTLIEATAFGAKVIIDRLEEYNIKIEEIVACGGIPDKNPLLMQIYADVLGRPIKISASSQTSALGAAIFGAVAAGKELGGYSSCEEAQEKMCHLKNIVYNPIPENKKVYSELFALYKELHDIFGTKEYKGNLFHIMKKLLSLKMGMRRG
jgi:L-ribulokinase